MSIIQVTSTTMATNENIPCPKCSGKGEVPLPESIGSPSSKEWVTCRMCQGNGTIPHERK
jgi:DnaJ-class molecular chaperone